MNSVGESLEASPTFLWRGHAEAMSHHVLWFNVDKLKNSALAGKDTALGNTRQDTTLLRLGFDA